MRFKRNYTVCLGRLRVHQEIKNKYGFKIDNASIAQNLNLDAIVELSRPTISLATCAELQQCQSSMLEWIDPSQCRTNALFSYALQQENI